MSMDARDIEWMCSCQQVNPDYDEWCNGCGEYRYQQEMDEEPLDSGPGLYAMESHRMQEAQQQLKR